MYNEPMLMLADTFPKGEPVAMKKMAAEIRKIFDAVEIDPSWAFADKTRRETTYLTHGYHRYPAKFIPQVVSRLLNDYTDEMNMVVDPFGGCGTTIVESKLMGRRSLGVDINPVAALIAKVKTTPLQPLILERSFAALQKDTARFDARKDYSAPTSEKINYWFSHAQKNKLAFILSRIQTIENKNISDFFRCAISNIFKNCSIWNQKSNKPLRDLSKIPEDPFVAFNRQCRQMMRGNEDFYRRLKISDRIRVPCDIRCRDAKKIPHLKNESVDMIVTSPPYVTSYEYADLHQLSVFWFEYSNDLHEFRKSFIGSTAANSSPCDLHSDIAEEICDKMKKISTKMTGEISAYYGDMLSVFRECKRILKIGGKAGIVIGNTALKGVGILNAQVFAEQLSRLGFRLLRVIKREIPSKNIPSVRDKKTGRFVRLSHADKFFAYPVEYIVIVEKVR
jgi:DNA modification methylase